MSGADLSSVPRNVGQGQRVGQVPLGWLVAVHASRHERFEPSFHFGHNSSQTDTGRSTLEGERSARGAALSFREAGLDGP